LRRKSWTIGTKSHRSSQTGAFQQFSSQQKLKGKTMKTPHIKSTRRSPWRRGFRLIPLALVCLALSPQARGVCQEGCDLINDNTFLGDDALLNNTDGYANTAVGFNALYSNTTGIENTANGDDALHNNTSGAYNTATGAGALYDNTTGNSNTADGHQALVSNTTGSENTATGDYALNRNTTGEANTAAGSGALGSNTTGNFNTATGASALESNTTGSNNTANGLLVLFSNTTGFQNTANGSGALTLNTTGHRNTANGYQALFNNIIGTNNTAEGFQALYNNTGSNNVGLGFNAGTNLTTGSGNVCIGYNVLGVAGESNTTRIKNVYTSMASGRAVYVNSDNKIGTLVSSRRFKDEIKPMDTASEAILALKPVTFRYKKEIEPNGAIMFGLIAEEVEKVDPDLVTRNDKGEAEAVRYEAVNAMLLNEFLKEHRKVKKQETTISQLKSMVAQQQKQIEALTTGLQKVTDQLELSKSAPRTVLNNQ
jgi:uncharacterized coiled-coil protein SlyX